MTHSRYGTVVLATLISLLMLPEMSGPAGAAEGYPSDWDTLDGQGLVDLADQLASQGEAAVDERVQLAGFVADKFLTTEAATRQLTCYQWRELTWDLREDLSKEARATWGAAIRGAYAGATSELIALDAESFVHLGRALKDGLGDPHPGQVAVQYVAGTDKWKSLSREDLSYVALLVSLPRPDGKEARARLAQHMAKTYLADPAQARTVDPEGWYWLTYYLGGALSAEGRDQWATSISEAFTESPDVMTELTAEGMKSLIDALRLLGSGPAGQSGLRMAEHLTRSVLGDVNATRQVTCRTWNHLTRYLGPHLDYALTEKWIAGLQAAYGPSQVAGMTQDDVVAIANALWRLGDAHSSHVAAGFVSDDGAWRSSTTVADLLPLLKTLRGRSQEVKAARQAMAGHIAGSYLADPTVARSQSIEAWRQVAEIAEEDLSDEARADWANRIAGAFAGDEGALAALEASELNVLTSCLASLDDERAAAVALGWLQGRDDFSAVSASALAQIAHRTANADPQAIQPVLPQLEQTWLAADAQEPFSLSTIWSIQECLRRLGHRDKARAWVMRAYSARLGTEQARDKVSLQDLGRLGDFMRWIGLTRKGKGYLQYATALARHAREGTLDAKVQSYTDVGWEGPYHPRHMSWPLGTPEARQVLQNELVDPQGHPRLGVAKVLAWTYHRAAELGSWRDYLDTKVEASDGDEQALWLAAKGYASMLVEREINEVRRKYWLNRALPEATSNSVRLALLREYADYYRSVEHPGVGAKMLESLKHQFDGERRAAIDALQNRLRQAQQELGAKRARLREVAILARDHGAGTN